ncbi:histone-lysine N-methyltransferase SETMAR-like protein [Plakobranchus ocellatus]|uniref:Histone-lysine N-methyltransferase SETMAR-like protein n=1 Tax=Plakobranchus ocellatus TaxID=259542 RepID=A0AAV3YI68_9GAST|nr:histone-lysine N-methyltransferase SETMAR-like protein [Plakobranchus ocellatus]
MATSNDILIKERSVIEFLAAERCSAANIHARMKTVYGEMCISDCAVRKWVRIFKGEDPRETILRDRKRSGRPLSASVTAHREKVDCMIRANRRVTQKEIANAVGISKERVHHIVTTTLGYRKVSARWVPRQLTVEMKAKRKDMCTQLLELSTLAISEPKIAGPDKLIPSANEAGKSVTAAPVLFIVSFNDSILIDLNLTLNLMALKVRNSSQYLPGPRSRHG